MWRCCRCLLVAPVIGVPSDCGAETCGLEDAAGMLSLSRRESLRGLERVRAGVNFTCGESCSVLGGICANPPEECTRRRAPTDADGGALCHCQVERPSRYSTLQRTAVAANSKLRETAFVMTHDSGFIGRFDLKVRLGQAQTINLVEQLNCGARALDIRLLIKDGEPRRFYFHHGEGVFSWASDGTGETLQGEWPKLRRWAREHPDQLVLLVVSHCALAHGFGRWSGSKCSEEQWTKEFQSLALPFETNCGTLSSMPFKEAMQRSQLPGGGHILGVDGECVKDNWDESVTSLERVRPYVEKTMERMRGEGGPLFQVQSFIQQTLLVPMDSSLNHDILAWITNSSLYEGVNLLEVNLMCAHGASMATALGYSISPEDYQTCRTGCLQACERHGACEQL